MGRYYLSVNQTSLKMGVPQLLGEQFWLGPEYNLRSEFGELAARQERGQIFVNMATNVFNPAAIKMGWAAAQY